MHPYTHTVPYYVLEGIDYCGKDKQADMLVEHLRQKKWMLDPLRLNEPDDTLPTGKLLREYLKDGRAPDAHAAMFLANRMELLCAKVLPALGQYSGVHHPVVCSRSFVSSLVYQQGQHSLTYLLDIHANLPVYPTKVLVYDLDAEEALKRGRSRPAHEFYEKLETQKVNRKRFLDLKGRLGCMQGWNEFADRILYIDASGSPGEVHQLTLKALGYSE